MHPLDGAFIRARRAQTHIIEFARREEKFWKHHKDDFVLEWDDGDKTILGYWRQQEPPLVPLFSVILGEAIYNFRAALNYLVYELAYADSGHVQGKMQFPIESCKETFWNDRRKT